MFYCKKREKYQIRVRLINSTNSYVKLYVVICKVHR